MRAQKPPAFPVWLSGLALVATIGLIAALERPRRVKEGPDDSPPFGEKRSDEEPRALQLRRARQRGRGRRAASPLQIPWPGWKDILLRTYQQLNADRLPAIAAGVAFFALLAIFPATTALVSSYGLFAKVATISEHLAFLASLMPAGAFDIVQEQITRIVQKGDGKLSLGFVFGLSLAIWSANAGMKAMIDALNIIYDEREKRGFLELNAISLMLTVGAGAILLLAIGAVVVFPLMLNWVGLGGATQGAIAVLRWPALLLVVMSALAVLYRVGPSRAGARWQWLSVGAVAATVLWLSGSALFSYYLSHFADYDAAYGSLGAAIGLMMWLWLSAMAILSGAELNAEIEHQTARDSTTGAPEPLGLRGATMADTVGRAMNRRTDARA